MRLQSSIFLYIPLSVGSLPLPLSLPLSLSLFAPSLSFFALSLSLFSVAPPPSYLVLFPPLVIERWYIDMMSMKEREVSGAEGGRAYNNPFSHREMRGAV